MTIFFSERWIYISPSAHHKWKYQ